jgi:hypothetical protein
MTEHLPDPTHAELLAIQLVEDLRIAHPGIVEEWESQIADYEVFAESDYPDFVSPHGAIWWLESEVEMAAYFAKTDKTGREDSIGAFCVHAAQQLRDALTVERDNHPL